MLRVLNALARSASSHCMNCCGRWMLANKGQPVNRRVHVSSFRYCCSLRCSSSRTALERHDQRG